jgi:hypothetical protein
MNLYGFTKYETVIKIILLFFCKFNQLLFSKQNWQIKRISLVRREPITIIKIMKGTQILQVMFHSITNLDNIFFQDFMYLTYYSIIGNYDIENHLHNNLSNYPYDSNLSGNFENSDSVLQLILRLDLENQLLSHNNLYGNHLKAKIRPYHIFIYKQIYTRL